MRWFLTPHPCQTANAHQIFYVPLTFMSHRLTSGSGGYYYTAPMGCNRFVVDVKMATYSARGPVADGQYLGEGIVLIRGEPYDLPSSSAFGGTLPTTGEDCNRFIYSTTYYLKRSGEAAFKQIGRSVYEGSWGAGSCGGEYTVRKGAVGQDGVITASASAKGWDTYRAAVQVHLRSSAQEAAVALSIPGPS